jgi:hypothetical protein
VVDSPQASHWAADGAHIFVDDSNLMAGAQSRPTFDLVKLVLVIEGKRKVKERVAIGSKAANAEREKQWTRKHIHGTAEWADVAICAVAVVQCYATYTRGGHACRRRRTGADEAGQQPHRPRRRHKTRPGGTCQWEAIN